MLALHALLEVAESEGNHLGAVGWEPLLSALSLLGRLHLLGSGGALDEELPDVAHALHAAEKAAAEQAAAAGAGTPRWPSCPLALLPLALTPPCSAAVSWCVALRGAAA